MLDKENGQDHIVMKISSDLRQISFLAEGVYAMTLAATGQEKCAMELQAAIVEALNNVFIHAYDGEGKHPIILTWQLGVKQLRIEIIDHGHSLDAIPQPKLPDLMNENGRGWWIISSYVDEYSYSVMKPTEPYACFGFGDKYCNILTLVKTF
jgi:anti-sigma regulatory factor (Ser/Thr protein kinase)